MTLFTLIRKNLGRKISRTVLLMFSVAIAFLVFGVLTSFNDGFNAQEEGTPRLVSVSKIGVNEPLPVSAVNRIRQIDGVADVAFVTRLRGYYREPQTFVGVNAVPVAEYASVFRDDFVIAPDTIQAIETKRNGAVVGAALAKRMGWVVGDRVTITSRSFRRLDGGHSWDFEILGLFQGTRLTVDTGFMIVRYDYFNEARQNTRDTVDGFVLTTEAGAARDTVRRAIDTAFANSPAETRTGTESELNRAFSAQFANVSLIVDLVLTIAFGTILMIVANTMAFAVRERTTEIGILKALGFSSRKIAFTITAETLCICVVGGVLGLVLAAVAIAVFQEPLSALAPSIALSLATIVKGVGSMLAIAAMTTIIPLTQALRLNVSKALKRS
jgi:putative ABC transport system permease protein